MIVSVITTKETNQLYFSSMDSIKPSSHSMKTNFSRTIRKVISLQPATRGKRSKDKTKEGSDVSSLSDQSSETKFRNRAAMEAFVAKLFAGISSIKAAYAELQFAQYPYNGEAIQIADEAVINQLKALSELKNTFFENQQINLSPQVTLLLAEIEEQQSMIKTYEITLKKMESKVGLKDSDISSLKKQLEESVKTNRAMEKKLNASGSISVCFGVKRVSDLNPSHFVRVLHYALRSVRSFVKLMVEEMESARWDLDAAANSIEPGTVFMNPTHKCYAFEAFVCRVMFDGFNDLNFLLPNETSMQRQEKNEDHMFDEFTKLKSVNPKHFISENPKSMLAKFIRFKYLNLVHPKMECSFFGNLNQRSLITRGEYPRSAFFTTFAEMAKRVWVLHCLGFSFDCGVSAFQVRKDSRFSDVFMECVTDEMESDLRVSFTVVPGFKLGKTTIQCQVYLS